MLFFRVSGARLNLFLFLGDLNSHHKEWFGSATTNRHGVAAFHRTAVSSCDQLAIGPTHARGGTLDLLMTDVPYLVVVAVVAPISNSYHSSIYSLSKFLLKPRILIRDAKLTFMASLLYITPVVRYPL